MANSLSILPDGGRTRVFICPVCKETIALGTERCRFCGVVIDQQAAGIAADLMDKVNLAISEAEDIRAMLVPREGLTLGGTRQGDWYFLPVLLVRWWVRFGKVRMDDPELLQARADMRLYSWIAAGVLAVILIGLAFPVLQDWLRIF